MSKHQIYIIPGNPIPLARTRIGNRRCWDIQKNLKLITSIKIKKQHKYQPYYHGPLHMSIIFYFKIPKTYKRKIKPGTPHAVKPDLDNLVKFICDVCQTILFDNDSRIAEINCKKIYDNNPRTEFLIRELDNAENY